MDKNPIPQPVQQPSLPKLSLKLPTTLLIIAILAVGGYFASAKFLNLWPFEASTVPIPTFTPRPSSSLTPTPSSPIEGWKTYTNIEYGFEFQMPVSNSVRVAKDGSVRIQNYTVSAVESGDGLGKGQYFIEIFKSDSTDFKNYSEHITNIEIAKIGNYVLYSGDRSDANISPLPGYDTYIPQGNFTLVLVASIGDEPARSEVVKILSTFKFIGLVDTSTWKTYSNAQYGFEIKYPNNWEVVEENGYVGFATLEKKDGIYPLNSYSIHLYTGYASLDAWFRDKYKDRTGELIPTKTNTTFQSLNALKISDPVTIGGCESETIAVLLQNKVYQFENPECSNDATTIQILSTFKFK